MTAGTFDLTADPPKLAEVPLAASGERLLDVYAKRLESARADVAGSLPNIDERVKSDFAQAREAAKAAVAGANGTRQSLQKIQEARALVDHAKGKWIGGAEKGIAQAEAALKTAVTEAARKAAGNELAKWQANRRDGIAALKERQKALDEAMLSEPEITKADRAAQASLEQARTREMQAAKLLLSAANLVLSDDKLDAKLVRCAVLAEATPRGLAVFAQQGKEQEALVEQLLADQVLMKRMLEAGGAKFGKYGRAMEILAMIRKACPNPGSDTLQRLALATSLEHAVPVEQSNPKDQALAPSTVDPVKRYLHYEKAFLDGELDPAFGKLTTWEYRMVVGCDAPDAILAWGREMLRNYRPDHINNPDHGWRYSASVRTDVQYGSQNVKNDLSSLHTYQNIIRNGGVCGRRAFFGRFILRAFGVPTWGVTQKAHAALSHWTPEGWVVNLGAGFEHSWWDKDEAPRGGADFLLETQARAHPSEYSRVLRARWIGTALGEQPFNERKGVDGGFWSGLAHFQSVLIANEAVALGPLGRELAEANESPGKTRGGQSAVAETDRKEVVEPDGAIHLPAVAYDKPTGPHLAMKSFAGGMQVHCSGGFAAEYVADVPRSGKYVVTARVVTVQDGQVFSLTMNNSDVPVEIVVPYTLGSWKQTPPVEIPLDRGRNVLRIKLREGSRGVAVKEWNLTPVR